jgi:EPS-associated MarR family transcriptional regulator
LRQVVQMLSNDMRFRILRLFETNPRMSQRELARELDVSLGKVNYCVRALIQKGWVKATNFKNSHNKAAYMYLLTPRGIEQKTALTLEFLRTKTREYEELRAEIDQVRRDAALKLKKA